MNNNNRRTFLKRLGQGTVGAMAFPAFGNTLTEAWATEGITNSHKETEAYWERVKSQFHFAEGLLYFNNASLGRFPLKNTAGNPCFQKYVGQVPLKIYVGRLGR